MTPWTSVELAEVCTLITDGTHHSPTNLAVGDYKYVTAKNIRPWGLDISNITYVDSATHQGIYARCPVEYGDVLYIKDGVTTGIAALNTLEEPFSMLSSVALLKPERNVLEPRYLKHWLNSPVAYNSMTGEMTGTAIKRLVLKQIRATSIPLAPLPEQKRIADKLDSVLARVDACRDRLDRLPALLKRFRQSILAAATSGRLTEDRREANLPKRTWNATKLENLCTTVFDGPFGSNLKSDDYTSSGVRVVRLENIGHLYFEASKETYISDEKYQGLVKHSLQPDDILFSSFVDEEVRVCRYPAKLPTAAINKADCFCLRPDTSKCSPTYLSYRLASRATYVELKELVHGATRPRINLKQLRQYLVEVPELEEQTEIVRRVEILFAFADRLEARLATARRQVGQLTPALLAKAFRGELVAQDPADEPAAELLKRLAAQREAAPKVKRGRVRA